MTGRLRGQPSRAPGLRRRVPARPPLELAVLGATALLEVRDGRRDAGQLDELVDRRVARQLAALVRRVRISEQRTGPPTLRRVVVDATHERRLNAVVVLDCHERVVPVCVEVTAIADDWRITALATPEDHEPDEVDPDRPDWEDPASIEPW